TACYQPTSIYHSNCIRSNYYSSLIFHILLFFFLIIPRPPRSTLFPTRRSSDLGEEEGVAEVLDRLARHARERGGRDGALLVLVRSEEHTSELQSRGHLVCRLLLEKKKRARLIAMCKIDGKTTMASTINRRVSYR